MKRFPSCVALRPRSRRSMTLSLRTTVLATGCILAFATSPSWAQESFAYYYPAPGTYATTQGPVNIPAAGYYYNVPLNAVPATSSSAPAQGSTYSSSAFYYPRGSASTERSVGADVLRSEPMRLSAYVSGDGQDNPIW
jgi:hypothetical protein